MLIGRNERIFPMTCEQPRLLHSFEGLVQGSMGGQQSGALSPLNLPGDEEAVVFGHTALPEVESGLEDG